MHLTRRGFLWTLFALPVLADGGRWELDPTSVTLREELLAELAHVKSMSVVSLDPGPSSRDTLWEGYGSGGSASLDPAEQKAMAEALLQGLSRPASVARCFIPHHGVAVNDAYHVVICVTCSLLTIRRLKDGARSRYIPFNGDLNTFNVFLTAHNLPLSTEDL